MAAIAAPHVPVAAAQAQRYLTFAASAGAFALRLAFIRSIVEHRPPADEDLALAAHAAAAREGR